MHFSYSNGPMKVAFQTTVRASGSRYAAERIARACYMKFEQGGTKGEVLQFRADSYTRANPDFKQPKTSQTKSSVSNDILPSPSKGKANGNLGLNEPATHEVDNAIQQVDQNTLKKEIMHDDAPKTNGAGVYDAKKIKTEAIQEKDKVGTTTKSKKTKKKGKRKAESPSENSSAEERPNKYVKSEVKQEATEKVKDAVKEEAKEGLKGVGISDELAALDVPKDHIAHKKIRSSVHSPSVAFQYPVDGAKVNFQTTIRASGSRENAECIARLCYVKFESGAKKGGSASVQRQALQSIWKRRN